MVEKGGLKMRESAATTSDNPPAGGGRPGSIFQVSATGGRVGFHQKTRHDLANFLAGQLEVPVTDETGLTAKYDFTLSYSKGAAAAAPDAEAPPELPSAVQLQLGLRLAPRKGTIEQMVIDHMDKTPVEN